MDTRPRYPRPLHVSITPRVPPEHPACIRMATENNVFHFTAQEARIAAEKLVEAAALSELPVQQTLL